MMPGVGIFTVTKKKAQYNADSGLFSAPLCEVNFAEGNALADKKFYNFLKNEHQIDEVTAIRQFNEFSCVLWEQLHAKKVVDFPAIGSLVINKEGTLIFQPEESDLELFSDIAIKQALRDQTESVLPKVELEQTKIKEPVEKVNVITRDQTDFPPKNYWWLVAIGLAVISIVAIVYYYSVIL